jgi:hypothetical protein
MTRLLLHIGHPKTGTTALQSVLSANAATLLKEASILYPTRTNPSEYKHAFAIPWLLGLENEAIRRRGRCKNEELQKLSHSYWESVKNEVNETKPETLILSAEGFWIMRKATQEKINFFKENLYAIAGRVDVAGYLKSPASYFTSMINQKLRNYREVFLPRPNYYRSSLETWEATGFDQHSWRIFDRNRLTNRDIIDDFCTHHLPADLNPTCLKREGVEQANSSVSNEALVILEKLVQRQPILRNNIYDHRRSKVVEILRQADRAVGGQSRPCLTEEATASVISRCQDLGWLADRGLTFPDIDPALIDRPSSVDLPEKFTCVADFCPVDTERLASLRSIAEKPIQQLFQANPKRFFWPFRLKSKN